MANKINRLKFHINNIFPFIFFSFLPFIFTFSNTYYVNSIEGNDNHSGLRINQAWKTIDKVNNYRFLPGDSVLFKAGSTWREELIIPGDNLTFGSYGIGEKPKIIGSEKKQNWKKYSESIWVTKTRPEIGWIWFLDENMNISWGIKKQSIRNLNSQFDFFINSKSLYIYSKSDPNLLNIEASVRDFGIISGWYDNGKSNINISDFEIFFTKNANLRNIKSNKWKIENIVSHHSGAIDESDGQGIQIEGSNNLISNCKLYENGQHGIFISSFGNAEVNNVIVEKNIVYNNYHTGIDIMNLGGGKSGLSNIIIRYNKVYDTKDHKGKEIGIQLLAYSPGKITNAKIYYNIVYNIKGIAFAIFPEVDTVLIANNTAYDPESACFLLDGGNASITCKNNIGVGNLYYTIISMPEAKNKILNNNLWYGNTNVIASVGEKEFVNWENYIVSTGFDKESLNNNPKFLDPSNSNFGLKQNSKCINNGAELGFTHDFYGNQIIDKPDIGAVEFIE